MTIARKFAIAVAALAAPASTVVVLSAVDPVDARATTEHVSMHSSLGAYGLPLQRTATPKPKEKPKSKGKLRLIKSGAEVTLTTEQSHRQAVRQSPPPARPEKPAADVTDTASGSKIRTPPEQRRIAPFRLNIGICGLPAADGTVPGPTRCQPIGPDQPVRTTPTIGVVRQRVPRPQDVTWTQVLAETGNVLFPGLSVKVQPTGRTLVNLETIVYTDESKVSATQVTLLGFLVDVEATPMSYVWSFGDGTTLTTTSPGKPYPAEDITHRYLKRGNTNLTVTTNYAARFRVAGGNWQYVDGTVPITGPATPLLIREAVSVLVDPPN